MLDVFLNVSGGYKNRLSRPNSHILCCSMFQVVSSGYCQTTVNEVVSAERKLPCFGLRSLLLFVSRRRLRNLRLILDYLRLLGRCSKLFLSPTTSRQNHRQNCCQHPKPHFCNPFLETTR